ncbi:hypothetical protein OAB20_03900 [Winogradskyella sp.]|nr:hypothetical protein [Winogradskyella sp.]
MNSRYLLLLFLVIANCKSNSSFNEDAVIFKTFPSIEKIELNVFKEIPDIAVDGLLNYNDSLIVIRNTANTSKYHFTAFDLNKKETVFDILESWRQENQSMAFLSYGISKEKLWVFDIMKN